MAICDSPAEIGAYLRRERPEGVILVDRFLEGALEFDVDALCDGDDVLGRRGHGARRGGRDPLRATRRACCRRSRSRPELIAGA